MSTEKTNASTKPAAGKETKEQAPVKGVAIGSADNLNASSDEQKKADEDGKENSQASAEANDDLGNGESEYAGLTGSAGDIDFQIRGFMMAIIIRLPQRMRILSDSVKLDELVTFIMGFDDYQERIVAVELLKAIGETAPEKIASGAYKDAVQAALDVINGVSANRHELADHSSQQAAFNRMQMVTAGLAEIPAGAEAEMREQRAKVKATPDQEDSMSRLYAGTTTA